MNYWKSAVHDTMVCYCKNVTKGALVKAIQAGHLTLKALQKETKACTGNQCAELNPSGQCCSRDIHEIIALYAGQEPTSEDSCCDCC